MPLQATSGAASYDGFGGGVAAVPQYIEDVFSTYLYTGTGATNNIVNGVDLATYGGLVWTKARTTTSAFTFAHALIDTLRGAGVQICSDRTDANYTQANSLTGFNTNGYTLGTDSGGQGRVNNTSYGTQTYVSWTFAKAPKFFDVVTLNYTSGAAVFNHSLGSVPGFVILKVSSGYADNWWVYHRSLGNDQYVNLNLTSAAQTSTGIFSATDTTFTVKNGIFGASTIVAYLFAHNAGGFGLTGTDNVISCGSFTTDGSGNATVDLGYEPQWVLIKYTTNDSWRVFDNMRGMSQTNWAELYPNTSDAEVNRTNQSNLFVRPNATGFTTTWSPQAGNTAIYIAIRRGPMKVPTSGTSVYTGVTRTGTGATANITSIGFPTDLVMSRDRQSADADFFQFFDRLRGPLLNVKSTSTLAETSAAASLTSFASMNGFSVGADTGQNGINRNTSNYVYECFRRAPSFFDEVCYTGTGSATTVTHNLGVVPELMIAKSRSAAIDWVVYSATTGATKILFLNQTAAAANNSNWNNTAPTSSVFSVGSAAGANGSGNTYVAYLFATCAGVSKVGSYTGTGTTLQVNCGFTSGARFVLIKRTDSTGDWYVWDSARGIVAGNDPYLLLNSTAAEVTSTDYIDTYSAGFEISSTAPAAINASGGTFIFLAIA